MHILYLPIEPLEERYSKDWLDWTLDYFSHKYDKEKDEDNPFSYDIFLPSMNTGEEKIQRGQFLDCINTNRFKAAQLEMLTTWMGRSENEHYLQSEDTVVYIQDGWYPGIEMLGYIRDTMDYKFKIAALLHAGTWDYWDFLSQKNLQAWVTGAEESWLKMYDRILVATEFHKNLITSRFTGKVNLKDKIHVVPFPIYPPKIGYSEYTGKKENIVVFPHRLTVEKGIEEYEKLKTMSQPNDSPFCRYYFIKTKICCENKNHYYDTLKRSKYAVSFSKQETWGIAMQEAVMLGCVPIVPDNLSYHEMYPDIFKYKMDCHAVENAFKLMSHIELLEDDVVTKMVDDLAKSFIERGERSFDDQMAILEGIK